MKDIGKLLVLLGVVISMAACSGSKPVEDEEFEDDIPIADADTDEVPEEDLAELDEDYDDYIEDEIVEEEPPTLEEEVADAEPEPLVEEEPVSEPAPVAAPSYSGTGQYFDYTVKSGDTLMKIAFETYGDLYQWRRVYDANRDAIPDYNNLSAGTTLRLEQPDAPVQIDRNGTPYLIKLGDTLGTISRDVYGTPRKWRRLWENNSQLIRDPNRIYAGFYLYYTFSEQDRQEKQQFDSQPLVDSGDGAPSFSGATEAMDLDEPKQQAAAPDSRSPSSAPATPGAAGTN